MEETFSKEMEMMKKIEMLEMKTSVNQIKTTEDGIISK
jgi:hypothetical protein